MTVALSLAVLACGGSASTHRHNERGGGGPDPDPATVVTRQCPVPEGARLVEEAVIDPARVGLRYFERQQRYTAHVEATGR